MKCPTCASVDLVMSERQGIEIDYCPTCRGVWLDRGELDKIIERTQPAAAAPQPFPQGQQAPPHQPVRREEYRGGDHHGDHRDDHGYGGKHKRKSFLAELFD